MKIVHEILIIFEPQAYVYVGIYGFSYLEAGRNVIELFQQKGWSVIISDDLCDRVLFMVSLAVGVLTGVIGWALAATNGNLLAEIGSGTGSEGFL